MRGIQNYFIISLTNNRIIKFLCFLMKINIKLLIFSIINYLGIGPNPQSPIPYY